MFFPQLIKDKTFIRQFAPYFLLVLAVSSLLGLLIYYSAVGIIREETEKFYTAIVYETQRNIDNRFQEIRKLNLQLMHTGKIRRIMSMQPRIDYSRVTAQDFIDISQELTNYKLLNSYIDEIFLHFTNDDLIVSSSGRETADNFFSNIFILDDYPSSARDFLLKDRERRTIIPHVKFTYLGRKYDTVLQTESLRPSGDSNIRANVVTAIGKGKIEEMLGNLKEKGDYSIYIIDRHNKVVAGNFGFEDMDRTNGVQLYQGRDCVLSGKTGGVETIFYHAPSGINDWDYVAAVPISTITQRVEAFRNFFIIIFGLTLFLAIGTLVYLTEKSLSPLKKIVSLINREGTPHHQGFKTEFELIERSIENMSREKDSLRKEMEKYGLVLKNSLLSRLVKGKAPVGEEFRESLTKHGILLPGTYFKVLVFDLENRCRDGSFDDNVSPEQLIMICEAFSRILSELQLTGYVFEMEMDSVLVLLNFEDFYSDEGESGLSRLVSKIKEELEQEFLVRITMGTGSTYDSLQGLKYSFEEAVKALNYKLLLGKGKVIKYDEIAGREDYSYYYPMDKELSLIQSLKTADFECIEKTLDAILQENLYKRSLDLNVARCLFYDLEATAMKALQELNLSIFNNKVLSHDLSSLMTFNEMIDYVKKIYFDICELIKRKNADSSTTLIGAILQDIEDGFRDCNFSMSICAKKHGLSESSMSRFFKDKTGLYFSDYLNRRRIEKARELLAGTERTIKEIAIEVGYINDITFRRIFKKQELITPVQYRERLGRN